MALASLGDDTKDWIGLGNPYNDHDRDLFATVTMVTVRDGEKSTFWKFSWLLGLRPLVEKGATVRPL